MEEQLLKDFIATAQANNYNYDVVLPKFPELSGYDIQVLKDYIATAEASNYDYDTVNAKFPELFSAVKKKEETVTASASVAGSLVSPEPEVAVEPAIAPAPPTPEIQDITGAPDPDFFEERMAMVSPELIDRGDEDEVAQELTKVFKPYGFDVEPTSIGDAIKVTAANGQTIEVDLDPWEVPGLFTVGAVMAGATTESGSSLQNFLKTGGEYDTKKEKSEAAKLKKFLRENKDESQAIAREDTAYVEPEKMFVTREQREAEVKKINKSHKEVTRLTQEYLKNERDFADKYPQFQTYDPEYIKNNPEEYQMFLADRNILEGEREFLGQTHQNTKDQGAQLDRLAGEYTEMLAERGYWSGGVFRNEFIQGAADIAAGAKDFGLDTGYNPEFLMETDPEFFRDNYLKEAAAKGYDVPSASDMTVDEFKAWMKTDKGIPAKESIAIQNGIVDTKLKRRKRGEPIDYKEAVNAYSQYATSKNMEVTGGELDALRRGLDFLKDSESTPEAADLMYESFWGGALLGVTRSLPAMLFPIGGWAGRTAAMYSQITGFLEKEMAGDPDFQNISEDERFRLKLAIGSVSSVLEAVGLRNVLKQQGLLTGILMRVLKKTPANVKGKAFNEVVMREVNSAIGRGALVVTSAGLAEFETGFLQEGVDISFKNIYNDMKDKEMFETPETWSWETLNRMLYAGAQEAVGGFVLGTPGAISAARGTYDFTAIDDATFEMFENVSNLTAEGELTYRDMFYTNQQARINRGEISKADAQQEMDNLDEVIAVNRDIPSDLTIDQQKRSLGILLRRKDLQEQIEGKDPILVKRQLEELDGLNGELEEILYGTPEDAIQEQGPESVDAPESTRDSEAVGEGVPDIGEPTTEVEAQDDVTDEATATTEEVAVDEAPTEKQQKGLQRKIDKVKKDFAAATSLEEKAKAIVRYLNNVSKSKGIESEEDAAWYEANKAELEAEGFVFDDIGDELTDRNVDIRNAETSDAIPKGKRIINFVVKPGRVVDGKSVSRPTYDIIIGTGTTAARDALVAELEALEDELTTDNFNEISPKLKAAKKALKDYDDANFPSSKSVAAPKKAAPKKAAPKKTVSEPTQEVTEEVAVDEGATQDISENQKKESVLPEKGNFGLSEKDLSLKNERAFGKKGSVGIYVDDESGETEIIIAVPNRTKEDSYLGYKRIKEKGKFTNKWSIKADLKNAPKGTTRAVFEAAVEQLPEGHILVETSNISSDGITLWSNQLKNNYVPTGKTFTIPVNVAGTKVNLGGRAIGNDEFTIGSFSESEANIAEVELNKLISSIPDASVTRKKRPVAPGDVAQFKFDITLPEIQRTSVVAPKKTVSEPTQEVTEEEQVDIDEFFGEQEIEGVERVSENLVINRRQMTSDTRSRAKEQRTINRVKQLAIKAAVSLSKQFPDVRIVLHETPNQYKRFAGELARGSYDYNNKTVHINLTNANLQTVAHEVFHALILEKALDDPNAVILSRKMLESVKKTIDPNSEFAQKIDKFVDSYADRPIVQDEEYLAELTGMLASQYKTLNKPAQNAIKEFFRKLAKLIGIDKKFGLDKYFGPEFLKTDAEVVDLMNTISRKIRQGVFIESSDLAVMEKIKKKSTPEELKKARKDVEVALDEQERSKREKAERGTGNRRKETAVTPRQQVEGINPKDVRMRSRSGNRVGKGLSVKKVNNEAVVEEIPDLTLDYVRENAPASYLKNANLIAQYPLVRGVKNFDDVSTLEQADEVYEVYARQVADNLNWIMESYPEEYREISTLWYDGANKIANELAADYGVSPEQVAGIIASLSPQNDWYQNVRAAELSLLAFRENPVMSQKMIDYQVNYAEGKINDLKKRIKSARKAKGKSQAKAKVEKFKAVEVKNLKAIADAEALLDLLRSYKGKRMEDAPDALKPYYVRLYNEVNQPKSYPIISPDGNYGSDALTDAGGKRKFGWGSYTEIGKGVSIRLDGSQENISVTLGQMHKIRNFFNNIIDPMSKEKDITMDTHAIAAALLIPASSKTKEVVQNFGTGTANSGVKGQKGLYYANQAGYFLSAEENNMLPRQVQSVTWEAVRGLFTSKFKDGAKNVKSINDIWENYAEGNITIEQARQEVLEKADGINAPSWAGLISDESRDGDGTTTERGRGKRGGPAAEREGVAPRQQKPYPSGPQEATDMGYLVHASDKSRNLFDRQFIKGRNRTELGALGFYFTANAQKAMDYGGEYTYIDPADMNLLNLDEVKGNKLQSFLSDLERNLGKLSSYRMRLIAAQDEVRSSSEFNEIDAELKKVDAQIKAQSPFGTSASSQDRVLEALKKAKSETLMDAYKVAEYAIESRLGRKSDTDAAFSDLLFNAGYDGIYEGPGLYKVAIFDIDGLNDAIVKDDVAPRQQVADIENKIDALKAKRTKASEAEYKRDKAGKPAYSKAFFAEDDKFRKEIERLELLKLGLAPAYEQRVKISEELDELNKPFEREVGNKYYPRLGTVSKGEMTGEDSDLGGIYEAEVDGYLFRGVSVEDYNRIKKEGFIDTDLRGAISDKEGINLTPYSATAFNYLPEGVEGVVMAMKVSDKSGLFMIGADDYVRSSKPIPFTDVEFVTTPVIEGRYLSVKDGKSTPIAIKKVSHPSKKTEPDVAPRQQLSDIATPLPRQQKSVREVVQQARDNNFKDAATKDFLKRKGVPTADIDKAIKTLDDVYARVMKEIAGVIAKSQKRGVPFNQQLDNALAYLQGTKLYENTTDIHREKLIREVRAKFDKKEKRAPSAKRILGEIKDVKTVTLKEKEALKMQLRLVAKTAKTTARALVVAGSELTKSLKEMVKGGVITANQMSSVLRRFSRVDLFNPASIDSFLDYMSKIFADAEYGAKIARIKKLLPRAKKNIKSKIGVADVLGDTLTKLFNVNPTLIPMEMLEDYQNLLEMMGAAKKVLPLADINDVTEMANKLLNAVYEEISMAEDLAEVFANYENKVIKDGKLDYAATIEAMIADQTISLEEAAVMRKYKSRIVEPTKKEPKTEAELAEERAALMSALEAAKVNVSRLVMEEERTLARQLAKLMGTEAIERLSNQQLETLLAVIDNINNGFVTHAAQRLAETMNASNRAELFASATQESKPLTVSKFIARVKAGITQNNKFFEAIKRRPLVYIDQLFGNHNTTRIYDSIFKPLAKASDSMNVEIQRIEERLDKAENAISKSFKRNPNKSRMSSYKRMTYMLQREFESNPDNGQVNPAADFIRATIDHIKKGKSFFKGRDAEMLQQILDDFGVSIKDADGNDVIQIDSQKLYDSFNKAERNALAVAEDINKSLASKAVFTAAVIRGKRVNALNQYAHHNVLSSSEQIDNSTSPSEIQKYNQSLRASTKSKNLIDRTGAVTPLNFDVLTSVSRGAKMMLTDFYLTDPIRTSRKTISNTRKVLEERGDVTEQEIEIVNAVDEALELTLDDLLIRTFTQSTWLENAVQYISRTGYRLILASLGRFGVELFTNSQFVAIFAPKQMKLGLSKANRALSMGNQLLDVMNNLGSTSTSRAYPDQLLSGRMIETSIVGEKSGDKGGRAYNDVRNKMTQIFRGLVNPGRKGIEKVADVLISTPDKAIIRPLWMGSFEYKFEEITKTKPDINKITDNDEAYMEANQEALDAATEYADQMLTFAGSADNPFKSILKGKSLSSVKQSAMLQAYNISNRFMTNFLIYEFISAQIGTYAMMGQGAISRRQGAALLGAVATRMVFYTLLLNVVSQITKSMFGLGDEEEEKNIEKQFGQALASTAVSLIVGRGFGNIVKGLLNYGVENLNEEFLDELRDGDYDPYRDSIAYTFVPADKEYKSNTLADYIRNLTGSFGPFYKMTEFGVKALSADEKKDPAARVRQLRELNERLPLEVLGNLGLIPFYREIRMILLADIYKDMGKEKKGGKTGMTKAEKAQMKEYFPEIYEMQMQMEEDMTSPELERFEKEMKLLEKQLE